MDVAVCHLGRVGYREAWELQRKVQARLIAAKRSNPPVDLPHALLLVEHPPVYTLGKSGDRANLLLSESMLSERGAEFAAAVSLLPRYQAEFAGMQTHQFPLTSIKEAFETAGDKRTGAIKVTVLPN